MILGKVSVIIPCYNAETTIVQCVQSVLNQSYRDLEMILIDDGSKDNTVQVLQNILKQNKAGGIEIKIICQANAGPSSARNKGLEMAKGQYVAFLDSDDEWTQDKIKAQMACFSNPSIKLVGTAYNKKFKSLKDGLHTITFNMLLFSNYFPTPTVIVDRSVMKAIRFDEQMKYSEDYRVWLSIASNHKCALLNDVLCNNIEGKRPFGQTGLSANLWKMEQGELANYIYIYRQKKIGAAKLASVMFFSLVKYGVRAISTTINNIGK